MSKIKYLLAALAAASLIAAAIGCGGEGHATEGATESGVKSQQNGSNEAVTRINQTEKLPVLTDSSDAHNQKLFYTEQSDPNKVEYLTLIALDGTPYAHFTIRGQVSSMNTQETNPSQAACREGDNGNSGISIACTSIGLAEPNGVYQGNDTAHFAFTTSGAEIEWEGNFIQSDEPLSVKTPVRLALNESVAPTPTSLAHVSGGELPKRGG